MSNKITWNEENTAKVLKLAGEGEVSQAQLIVIAEEMGTTARSVGSKLRKLDVEVAKASAKAPSWTAEQEAELSTLVTANPGVYTYAELADLFQNGVFNAKQVQGKILNMELFGSVKKAEKKTAVRTYTPEQEAKFVAMANEGASIEALAAEFDKTVASIRGKSLSLFKSEEIAGMPKQEHSTAKEAVDVLKDLDVSAMSVADIAESTGKSERGIKSMLSRRGITCNDHDGAAKRAKLDNKAA